MIGVITVLMHNTTVSSIQLSKIKVETLTIKSDSLFPYPNNYMLQSKCVICHHV